MNIETLTAFFMWCTIINAGILLLWTFLCVFAIEWVYRIQSKWFSISREAFNIVIYSFLGCFKIFVLIFNVAPYVALLIIR